MNDIWFQVLVVNNYANTRQASGWLYCPLELGGADDLDKTSSFGRLFDYKCRLWPHVKRDSGSVWEMHHAY